MVKSTEEMREYNKRYYQQKREEILRHVLKKVQCPDCGRQVNHQNLTSHRRTKLCQRRRQTQEQKSTEELENELRKAEEQIEHLRTQLSAKVGS